MDYELEDHPSVKVLRFGGDLGARDDPELKKVFVQLRSEGRVNVAADMSQVKFLDSTTLGTLVWAMKNMREAGGDLRLFGLQGFVDNLFDMTSLKLAFRIFETEDEATSSFADR